MGRLSGPSRFHRKGVSLDSSRFRARTIRLQSLLLALSMVAAPGEAAGGSVVYTYDLNGRLTTALYDNGVCVTYSYDPNGNRLSRNVLASGAPNTPVWGTGVLGCFQWTAAGGGGMAAATRPGSQHVQGRAR